MKLRAFFIPYVRSINSRVTIIPGGPLSAKYSPRIYINRAKMQNFHIPLPPRQSSPLYICIHFPARVHFSIYANRASLKAQFNATKSARESRAIAVATRSLSLCHIYLTRAYGLPVPREIDLGAVVCTESFRCVEITCVCTRA